MERKQGGVTAAKGFEAAATAEAAVQNEKKTAVETGVLLDSMPYGLMILGAVSGLILVFGKKRYQV